MINSFPNSLKEQDSLLKNQGSKAYIPEVEFDKIEGGFPVKEIEWLCPSNNKIKNCCTTKNCKAKNPFFCSEYNCQTCSEHCACGPNIKITYIPFQMNNQLGKRKKLLLSLYRKEEEFVNKIIKMREKDLSSDIFNFLDAKLDSKMRQIFQSHQKSSMSNSEIQELTEAFQMLESIHVDFQHMAQRYEKKLELLLKEIAEQKNKIIQIHTVKKKADQVFKINETLLMGDKCFETIKQAAFKDSKRRAKFLKIKEKEREKKLESLKLAPIVKSHLIQGTESNSDIENQDSQLDEPNEQVIEHLLKDSSLIKAQKERKIEWINQVLGYPKKISLIFRGKQNSFSAQKFHAACDDVPKTLTLVKTKDKNIFGAYTPISWRSCEQQTFLADASKETFIFCLKNKTLYELVDTNKAICCHRDKGPIFGEGPDLYVPTKSNKFYQNIWKSYRKQGESGDKYSQTFLENKKAFSTIEEYQVYEVSWA